MSDRAHDDLSLAAAGRSLGRRLAVAGGSLAAIVSLFHHVPASTAALRGAATYAVVLLVAKLGLGALRWTLDLESRHRPRDEESR